MLYLLIVGLGMAAGVVGSIAGIGGGILIVPVLINVIGTPSQYAAGTSLVAVALVAISSVIAYHGQGRIDYRSAWLLISTSIPGSLLGAYIGKDFPATSFMFFYGLLLCIAFLFMFLSPPKREKQSPLSLQRKFADSMGLQHQYSFNRLYALVIAFFIGMISSLFGIGGGVLMVPSLIVLCSFPAHIATATSMFIILVSASFGSIMHIVHNHVIWQYVFCLAPGAYIGSVLGAKIAATMGSKTLIYVLRTLIFILALQMIGYAAIISQ